MTLSTVFTKLVTVNLFTHGATGHRHHFASGYAKVMVRPLLAAVLLLLSTQAALAVAVGDAVPSCALSPLGETKTSDFSQYLGKVLYVDFWASWCGPCAQSFPFLNELHGQFKGQGLQIVGVNLDENPAEAKDFLAQNPAQFTIAADVSKQCAKDFAVKAMPSSYLIDRNGKVHHVHLGFRPGESKQLRQIIEKLLSDKVAGL